jgi:hypothetical protein
MNAQTQIIEGALKYETREDWLNAFIDAARPVFAAANAPLPINVRVSVGFTSKGSKGSRIGECWSSDASEDGHYEIFLKPTLDNAARLCDVLTHELIHAAVGIPAGHGPAFKRVMAGVGLTGKATATVASAQWYAWALPIIQDLGPLPYGALTTRDGVSTGRPKQKPSLLKLECPSCGWLARVTFKHVQPHAELICPTQCGGILICEE